MTSAEQKIADQCFAVFRDACAAFERGDMVEHERLRLEHKRLAEVHKALAEREESRVQ
jgi:hypothetical protein